MIRTYQEQVGKSTHLLVPEYGRLFGKYPQNAIDEVFWWIYCARTGLYETNIEVYLESAFNKSEEIGLKLKDFGLDHEELVELLRENTEFCLGWYESRRGDILSRGLMSLTDGQVNWLLKIVDDKIRYFDDL